MFLLVVVGAAIVFAFTTAILFLTRDVRFKRRMEKLPRTPIADAPPGALVKITGRVATLDASGDFELEDETGRALVRASGAQAFTVGTIAEDARVTVVGDSARDEADVGAAPAGYRVPVPGRLSIRPIFIALVAACARPYLPARPTTTGETFAADDGTELFAQSWRPAEPKGVVIVVHGLKDHSDRYAAFATALVAGGWAVYAFDLRGHGRSAGRRVTIDSFDDYIDDLDEFFVRVRKREPDLPIFLFGHSMGGAIVTLFAIEHHPPIAGLILSAPALRIDVPPIAIPFATIAGDLLPNFGGLKLDDDDFSSDPAVVKDMRADPFVYDPPGPAHTAAELVGAIGRIWDGLDQLTMPILVMHGTKDRVTDPRGSSALADRVPTVRLISYPGLKHDLLHEPGNTIAADVIAWLDNPTTQPVRSSSNELAVPPAFAIQLDARWRHGTPDLGDVTLAVRSLIGPLLLGGEVGGGPHNFLADALVGIGARFGDGSFASLGAGFGGAFTGALPVRAQVPVEARVELQLGDLRALVAGRATFTSIHDVGWSGTFGLRLGTNRRYWPGAIAGAGPLVGVTVEKGWIGAFLGVHFWGG